MSFLQVAQVIRDVELDGYSFKKDSYYCYNGFTNSDQIQIGTHDEKVFATIGKLAFHDYFNTTNGLDITDKSNDRCVHADDCMHFRDA